MRKGSVAGYIFTFLLGAGITGLVIYIYTSMLTVSPEVSRNQKGISVEPPAHMDEDTKKKPENVSSRPERPGDRSYLPRRNGSNARNSPSADPAVPVIPEIVTKSAGAKKESSARATAGTEKQFSLFLKQEEINSLLQKHLAENTENGMLPPGSVRNAKLDIRGNELGLNALINLDQIAEVTATEEDRQKLETVKKYLPFIDTENLDLEIHGNFSVTNGMLTVDPDAQIKIGSMSMRLKMLHGLLLPGRTVPEEIPLQPVQGIQIDNLSVRNGGIQVSGTRSP